MEKKCKWCGNNLSEKYFQKNDDEYCSDDCYEVERFSFSKVGNLWQSIITPIILGLTAFGILIFSMVLYSCWKLDSSENKIHIPYTIISTFLLPISIMSGNIDILNNLLLPSRFIKKILSSDTFSYWIVFLNFIYNAVFNLRIFVFHDIIGGKVQNTDIFGFHFNVTIANSLLFASLFSIILIQGRKYSSK